jgi:hypothetical protein
MLDDTCQKCCMPLAAANYHSWLAHNDQGTRCITWSEDERIREYGIYPGKMRCYGIEVNSTRK